MGKTKTKRAAPLPAHPPAKRSRSSAKPDARDVGAKAQKSARGKRASVASEDDDDDGDSDADAATSERSGSASDSDGASDSGGDSATDGSGSDDESDSRREGGRGGKAGGAASVKATSAAAGKGGKQKDDGPAAKTSSDSAKSSKSVKSSATPGKAVPRAPADDVGTGDDDADAPQTFAEAGVCAPLCEAIDAMGWKVPSKIQAASLPHSLAGRDIIGLAETGSGKTGAFAIPVLQSLLDRPQPNYALVLSPTRELAVQIAEQFEALGAMIGLRCAVIVGGIDMMTQQLALARKPHVIVATPGRLQDHLENTKGFHLRYLKYLVIDEADKLLNMDFEKEINAILKVIPRERHTYLFSATMTSKVAKLQRASLSNPVRVEVSSKFGMVDTLIQNYLFMPSKHSMAYLAYILNEHAGQSSIIFVASCAGAHKTALTLRNLGFRAVPLHGRMSQPKRLGALNKFKAGASNILVATDVAARGLDIPSVDLVVNADVPGNPKDYVHRVGRTARAGRTGRAVTFVTQYDVELYQRIEAALEKRLDRFPCEERDVLLLQERVNEAVRYATTQMKEDEAAREEQRGSGGPGGRGGGGGGGGGGRGGRGGGRGGRGRKPMLD
jgi:ATP-dependent RNA helicase DDX47/RRP3